MVAFVLDMTIYVQIEVDKDVEVTIKVRVGANEGSIAKN